MKLEFGKSIAGELMEVYDAISLLIKSKTAHFKVDPTTIPLSNLEFVFAGPSGAKPKTVVESINACLSLFVNLKGNVVPISTACSHGYSTYERVKGVYVSYYGDYTARLSHDRATPTQVYYSTSTLPLMQLLWVRDPLKIFDGIKLVKAGEDFGLWLV